MSAALTRLDGWLLSATRWIAAAGMLLLFLNAMAVVVDVLLRALFRAPIDRLSDVSSVVYYVAAACCLPAATAARRHVTIRALADVLGPRSLALVETFAAALTAAVCAAIAAQAWQYALEVAATRRTLSQIRLSIAPFWAFVTAMVVLNCLVQLCVAAMRAHEAWQGTERR